MPSDKAHGATKNISDNASAVSRDCRSKALATAPHLNPTHVAHLSHSSTPKHTKKPPCAQQESQCARRLKERIARKGGLWWIYKLFLNEFQFGGIESRDARKETSFTRYIIPFDFYNRHNFRSIYLLYPVTYFETMGFFYFVMNLL